MAIAVGGARGVLDHCKTHACANLFADTEGFEVLVHQRGDDPVFQPTEHIRHTDSSKLTTRVHIHILLCVGQADNCARSGR